MEPLSLMACFLKTRYISLATTLTAAPIMYVCLSVFTAGLQTPLRMKETPSSQGVNMSLPSPATPRHWTPVLSPVLKDVLLTTGTEGIHLKSREPDHSHRSIYSRNKCFGGSGLVRLIILPCMWFGFVYCRSIHSDICSIAVE